MRWGTKRRRECLTTHADALLSGPGAPLPLALAFRLIGADVLTIRSRHVFHCMQGAHARVPDGIPSGGGLTPRASTPVSFIKKDEAIANTGRSGSTQVSLNPLLRAVFFHVHLNCGIALSYCNYLTSLFLSFSIFRRFPSFSSISHFFVYEEKVHKVVVCRRKVPNIVEGSEN